MALNVTGERLDSKNALTIVTLSLFLNNQGDTTPFHRITSYKKIGLFQNKEGGRQILYSREQQKEMLFPQWFQSVLDLSAVKMLIFQCITQNIILFSLNICSTHIK